MRVLPDYVRNHLRQFMNGMERRLHRDLGRVHDYYTSLRREAWSRLQKQSSESARERLRLESSAQEYRSKVADLKQKYDLRVQVELIQRAEIICPVHRVGLVIKRRKGERRLALDWNPLTRRLDPMPCEWGQAWERIREVCDERLHVTTAAGQAPCPQCGKGYCRACHLKTCPKCGLAN
jgi:hypothetical protein